MHQEQETEQAIANILEEGKRTAEEIQQKLFSNLEDAIPALITICMHEYGMELLSQIASKELPERLTMTHYRQCMLKSLRKISKRVAKCEKDKQE